MRDSGSAMASMLARSAGVVGTLWSAVAITVSRRQGLRTGDFVDEVPVDVQQSLAIV